jgi:hypothetical protein
MNSRTVLAVLVICVVGSVSWAQPPVGGTVAVTGVGPKAGMVTMQLNDMDVEPAKGVPFCATVTTEHTQTFADGNRIHSIDSSSVCRDSDGRTRREASLNLLGAAAQTAAPKLITIVDPVAGVRYLLDSQSKTAHRVPIGQGSRSANTKGSMDGPPEKGERVMLYQNIGTAGPNMAIGGNVMFKTAGQTSADPAPTAENLGDQTIEGIRATGTRLKTTIPAGEMGNEQPILITSERWYSTELKATILTKHVDPWAGELRTQLANVSTAEPEASLFQVPPDYKIVDEKAGPFVLQKEMLPPPPPPQ